MDVSFNPARRAMTKSEMESYRQKLQALRGRLKGDVSQLSDEALRKMGGEASGNLSNTPLHLADLGTDAFEQEMTLGLLENGQQTLEEIGAALDRIDGGTYGRCERCQSDIGKERLQAVPYTRYCVECARKVQEGEAEPTA